MFFFIVQFSVRENLLVVTGNPETKELKDMLPDIIKQVGPNQISVSRITSPRWVTFLRARPVRRTRTMFPNLLVISRMLPRSEQQLLG